MLTKIKITIEESAALEKLHYEINARKSLLSYMMTTMSRDNPYFTQYHEEYLKLYKQYEKLKSSISQKYVIPVFMDKTVTWELNFDTCELIVTELTK